MALDDTVDLLRGALSGDKGLLGRLLERLRPRLVLWLYARMSQALRAKVEPEDVAQDVLVAVNRDIGRFVGDGMPAFMAWFFTVAENRLRDLVDHFGAIKRRLPPPHSFSQTSPSTAASRREDVARLMQAIDQLPENLRQVIVLVRIESRTVSEVAVLLGISENAVRVRYCRALKLLRRLLGGDEGNGAPVPAGKR
jgi:RNA polymerase sigma-70 factor (ECF subfamily)